MVGHQSRLNRLHERLRALGVGDWCPKCGGIGPRRRTRECLVLNEGEEPKQCKKCELVLDEKGKALGWLLDEKQVFQTVVVHSGPAPHPDD